MKILLFFLAISATTALAQTTISGRVSDPSGHPLQFANILLLDTYDGATAGEDGSFTFSTEETGEHTLIVRFIGFREHRQTISLDGSPRIITVTLREEISQLNAVTITAGSFTASDQSRRTVFRPVDIATTAGATADIAGALNTLPGTQKVGESGRLFVRGGDGTETRTFIDGMVVLEPYSPTAPNTPSRGRFLPFMFKGTSFSTGGYSAEFGNALSSALVLDSKDKSEITRTDIGILSVGGDVAHTQAWDSGSAAAKVQYTNIRPYFGIIPQDVQWEQSPIGLDATGAVRQQVGKGMIKLFANASSSKFSLYQSDIDVPSTKYRYALANDYHYVNGFYKTTLNDNWILRGGISYSDIREKVSFNGTSTVTTESGLHVKSVVEGNMWDGAELRAGAEVQASGFTRSGAALVNEVVPSLFAETEIYASNRFVVRAGARSEHNNLQQNISVDPRLSFAYKTGDDSQVSFAYGKFRQSASKNFLFFDRRLRSEKASHLILNYQLIRDDRTLRLEAYLKNYQDLVKFAGDGYSNGGTGYARGLEVFWRDRRSVDRLDYWISYSLLDTRRHYLHYPYASTPSFASKHNFSAVVKYFVTDWKSQLGATFSYASGRPYHNPNSQQFNSGRTPSYHDVSFNWSYLPKPNLILYFSCTNLTGRENIFGYEFGANRSENGMFTSRPIRQPAPRFLFVGIFITLSKEKNVSQLPEL